MSVMPTLRRQLRRRRLTRRLEENIRAGVGLYGQEWVLNEAPVTSRALAEAALQVAAWCEETMAATRRPYGIDQMALALAVAHPGSEPIASTAFGVFRPAEFYQDGGQRDLLLQFIAGIDPAVANAAGVPIRIAATLFSWGDVARAALWTD